VVVDFWANGELIQQMFFLLNVHPPILWGFMIQFDLRIFSFKWIGEKPPPRLIFIGNLLGKYPSPMDPMGKIISYAWQFCW